MALYKYAYYYYYYYCGPLLRAETGCGLNIYCMFRNQSAEINSSVLDGEVVEETVEGGHSSRSADSVGVDDIKVKTAKKRRRPSLFRCLARVYGPSLLKSHFCKLLCDVLLFVGPIIQR